ncbi:DUF6778 family protein [Rhodovulum sp. YNF3179]
MFFRRSVSGLLLAVLVVLAGCGAFRTDYPAALPAAVSKGWTVSTIDVIVPDTLTVSEAPVIAPEADIVWREEPAGDRRAQVARIFREGAEKATATLDGPRPVRLEITLVRFHALTLQAEALPYNEGVHAITFTARILDAQTGAELVPATRIDADMPAIMGSAARLARSVGLTQRVQIVRHLETVFAGWLGIGPDPRQSFTRIGV